MHYKHYLTNRALVSELWWITKDTMATHIFGKPPRRLFVERRPLESNNHYALDYRLNNFEPITKQPFLTAIDSIVEAAEHVYAPEVNIQEKTWEWLSNETISVAQRKMHLRHFVLSHLALVAEADPNSAMVVLPVHPREELIPEYGEELPDFNSVINEPIEVEVKLIPSDEIHYIDESVIIFKGGEWLYSKDEKKKHYAPYFYQLSAEETILHYPVRDGKEGYSYEDTIYYANELERPPFTVIGNNIEVGEIHGELVTYSCGTFPGAVAIMNECLGLKSDSQIVDTRFTYPEKIASYQACNASGCMTCNDRDNPYFGLNVINTADGCNLCTKCNGSGKIAPDTSPFGTHILVKTDMFDDDGKFLPPIQFITPPLGSAEYLRGAWQETYAEGKRALFIIDQNMTNQSGASKAYDVRQKISVITGAVKNLFRIYEVALNSISGYLLEPQDIMVELPNDFNVSTSQDVTMELANSLNTSSVYTSELTRQLLLKTLGNDGESQKLVDFLQLTDRFFGMTIDEIVKMKAVSGSAVSVRDLFIHDKGFNILKRIQSDTENFANLTEAELLVLFNTYVDSIFTTPPISIA